jgi:hypothetical protein
LAGTLQADGLAMAALGGGSTGKFGLDVAFDGRGLTPRSLLQFLTGRGTVSLDAVTAAGVDANVVAVTVEKASTSDQSAELSDIATLVGEVLAGGRVALPSVRVPIMIANGAVRLDEIKIDTPRSGVSNRTTFDLADLKADIDWRIVPLARETTVRGRVLPGISVVYAGPLAQIATFAPRIQAEDLSRELSVRRLERSVEELERLRRQDEERARLEAERRRRIEEEIIAKAAEQAARVAEQAAAAQAAAAAAAQATPVSPSNTTVTPAPSPTPTLIVPPQPAQRRSEAPSAGP